MLLKYLESCPFTTYVASQIRRTPSYNQKQLMAFGSHDSVRIDYDATSLICCSVEICFYVCI